VVTVCTNSPFIIIYFPTVPLFLAQTMKMVSENLSLLPSVTVLYNYIHLKASMGLLQQQLILVYQCEADIVTWR
jgi:hypothetical protein